MFLLFLGRSCLLRLEVEWRERWDQREWDLTFWISIHTLREGWTVGWLVGWLVGLAKERKGSGNIRAYLHKSKIIPHGLSSDSGVRLRVGGSR